MAPYTVCFALPKPMIASLIKMHSHEHTELAHATPAHTHKNGHRALQFWSPPAPRNSRTGARPICMGPDVVKENKHTRLEIKEPKLPLRRTAAIKSVATEQDQDSPEAPAPTRTAGPAASEGDGGERAVPRSVQFLQWGRPVGGEDLVITDCTDSIIAAELQRKKKQAAARRPDGVCRSPNGVCQRM